MKKALLVGINYIGSQHALAGCINDINKIQSVLSQFYGYTKITTLTDNTTLKPTKKNILAQLQLIINTSTSFDQLVFYYSGHGTQVLDGNKDEADGIDEALYTIDNTIITDDEIFAILSTSKSQVNVFLDCCHSGTLCDLEYNIQPMIDSKVFKLSLESKQTASKINMFSGCLDSQTSADASFPRSINEYENNGAFTYVLLESLKEKNYKVPNKTLIHMMNVKLKQYGFSQIPQLSCSKLDSFSQMFLF